VQARADLAAGAQVFRWRYTTDGSYLGRGAYVDDVLVQARAGALFDGEKAPDAFSSEGWTLQAR
jgi:hypothetical protein